MLLFFNVVMFILISSMSLILYFNQGPSGFHIKLVDFSEHILIICSLLLLYRGFYQFSLNFMGASLLAGLFLRNFIVSVPTMERMPLLMLHLLLFSIAMSFFSTSKRQAGIYSCIGLLFLFLYYSMVESGPFAQNLPGISSHVTMYLFFAGFGFILFHSYQTSIRNTEKLISINKVLQEEISNRKKAEKKAKVLSGLLPICSFCNRIRDDKGDWKRLESYINDHSEAKFSHSLCPDCAKSHYPDFYDEKAGKG